MTHTATFCKNLVWDTHMIEGFGRDHFAHLVLNVPYRPPASESSVPLAGMGAFHNSEIELVWTGISKRNREPCAVIQYRAFFNRFELNISSSRMRGASHYWGDIWVSLVDKQIEHATLFETVSIKIGMEGEEAQRTGVLRVGRLEKILDTEK